MSFDSAKNDAMVFNAGYKGDSQDTWHYTISYSYDLTINKLTVNTAGSHELTLVFSYYNKKKYNSAKYSHCAHFKSSEEVSMPFVW